MDSSIKQEGPQKMSKKQFSRTVFARLTNSLADFDLKEKKLENRLKKVSKQLAADILKKSKAQEQAEKVQEVRIKPRQTSTKKKKKVVEEVAGE
jgi:Skp family chaperone for outer membrane proteins